MFLKLTNLTLWGYGLQSPLETIQNSYSCVDCNTILFVLHPLLNKITGIKMENGIWDKVNTQTSTPQEEEVVRVTK